MSSDTKRDRIAAVDRNVALGWCKCGEEPAHACECFGLYQLGLSQGGYPVTTHRSAPAYPDPHRTPRVPRPAPIAPGLWRPLATLPGRIRRRRKTAPKTTSTTPKETTNGTQ